MRQSRLVQRRPGSYAPDEIRRGRPPPRTRPRKTPTPPHTYDAVAGCARSVCTGSWSRSSDQLRAIGVPGPTSSGASYLTLTTSSPTAVHGKRLSVVPKSAQNYLRALRDANNVAQPFRAASALLRLAVASRHRSRRLEHLTETEDV